MNKKAASQHARPFHNISMDGGRYLQSRLRHTNTTNFQRFRMLCLRLQDHVCASGRRARTEYGSRGAKWQVAFHFSVVEQTLKEDSVLNRAFSLLLVVWLATGPLCAATEPLVGEWKLDISRSKIFDRMKVESIGGNRYSVDVGDGRPVTVAVDGRDQPGNDGVITSVLAEQPDSWKIVNKKDGLVVLRASWKLSQDGKTLTDNFASFAPDGSPAVSLCYVYKRTGGASGSGFEGTWESTSQTMDSVFLLKIQPYEGDGLSIIIPAQNQTENVKFDGKDYPNVASGRRVNEHTLEIENKSKGKITGTQQIKLSSDHKTLTVTVYTAGQNEPNNILVFERQ
jgi:hypothetical protein